MDHEQENIRFCNNCNQPLTFVSQYNAWYCYKCKRYDKKSNGAETETKDVVPQKTMFKCNTCGDNLFYIQDYEAHFCYKCNAYQQPAMKPTDDKIEEEPMPEPVPSMPIADEPEDDEEYPTCPECGIEVEKEWLRCPGCAGALNTDRISDDLPVTSHDEEPEYLHASEPTLDQEPMPEPANPGAMDKEPWTGKHEGEYKWEADASTQKESWEDSSREEQQEWQQTSQERQEDWGANASQESKSWKQDAYQERDTWTQSAESEQKDWIDSAEKHRDSWEESNLPTSIEKVHESKIPDSHAVDLDEEVEFLVDIFTEVFEAYLQDPMEPISFYKSKLRVLANQSEIIRKMKVGDNGRVTIYVTVNDFEQVMTALSFMFDTLFEIEARIAGKGKAWARAKEVLEPVVEEYEDGLDDLGILPRILKGAFSTRLPSGVPGFDEIVHGGIPNGASIIIQGATGGEKEMFANQFITEGLKSDGAVMVTVTMISPKEWRTQMKNLGTKVRKYEKQGDLMIVDWYTHKNERVRSVEIKGSIIKSSKSITNLEIAIDKAIKKIRDAPTKRAIIAILSPAIKALGFDKVYGFAQSIRGKFKKYGITGLFLLEKKMHDDKVITSLHSVFDGVFDIERQRVGDQIVRKIGVLSLKGSTSESDYRELELTRKGLVVKAKEEMQPPPYGEPLRGRF